MLKVDSLKLPISFDQIKMAKELEALENSIWVEHFVKNNYEGEWSILPLRGPKGETHPIRMSYSDPTQQAFEDTPFLNTASYFAEVIQWFQCPVKSVRLMKLSAGSRIKTHTDLNLAFEHGEARLHIPVKTNAHVHFFINDIEVKMREGECWYLKLSEPHSVVNNSETDRVHLVLDVIVNTWLQEKLFDDIK